jgi:hypothetical protein
MDNARYIIVCKFFQFYGTLGLENSVLLLMFQLRKSDQNVIFRPQ